MTDSKGSSRRQFLKNTSALAAATTLTGATIPKVHAAEDNTIRLALVGCGGRGTGAATNALSVENGPLQLVAMADVFERKQKNAYRTINRKFGKPKVEVPEDKRFIGFDAYKKAMDTLRAGDVVILTTPPAFRWVHFKYAIEKGLNVFMEKPVTVYGPSTRKMLKLYKQSKAKNLKVGVGLMCRHCEARGELYQRIKDGQIGDVTELRAYRMMGPTGSAETGPKPKSFKSDLLYQISRFHAFLWLSGGAVSDFLIHNIDECCWMKDDWPVKCQASGGRHFRGSNVDQNFDTYSMEYTFKDGTKLLVNGRTQRNCHQEFASYAHGTKGSAIISASSHSPARCKIFKGYNMDNKNDVVWAYPQPERNPYQLEWNNLIAAIREDKPHNEVERGAMASAVTSMGRMAAHTGQVITLDELINCEHEFAPNLEKLTMDSPSPLPANDDGSYPVPNPGFNIDPPREY